ncbi:MAG: hypothetical protein KKC01_11570 [Gammaproteobacteria bacterium]|nr:hypothetical protein [Gammaproteobacteria bacterium]
MDTAMMAPGLITPVTISVAVRAKTADLKAEKKTFNCFGASDLVSVMVESSKWFGEDGLKRSFNSRI